MGTYPVSLAGRENTAKNQSALKGAAKEMEIVPSQESVCVGKAGRVFSVMSARDILPVNMAPANSLGSATAKKDGEDSSVTKGSYTCACRPGFTGVDCELEVKECDSKPCRNGGICMDLENGYQCMCPPRFEGPHCEHSLQTCADSPCFHNGKCREKDNGRSYICECPPGFTGLNCERKVDKCTSLPCANGGRCILHANGNLRICRCRSGFTGQHCEININECAHNPCSNGGTCLDRINDFTCICPPGFTGRKCDVALDDCTSQPCLHGGTCSAGGRDTVQSFSCACPVPYTGPQCQFYNVPLPVTPSPTSGGEPGESYQWAAVSLGVGLVALVVLLCMVATVLRHIQRQRSQEEQDSETMNNLSEFQKDNLIPTSQLKNTNKKVDLEVDCALEKTNYKHNNYHLDYKSSKEYKDDPSQDDKNCEKCLEEKIPLSRMYR
ncbi:hypothetical protein JZ751_002840 [Albula glossodonta]|uniref:EGF-like domain-containing protein n=1 Tax=Albula glossodonta TaxID=121402 RepID=A0A8T2N809_9TELE|nr:hypothetical protein JZ751_002840 [Albula glossodonta]